MRILITPMVVNVGRWGGSDRHRQWVDTWGSDMGGYKWDVVGKGKGYGGRGGNSLDFCGGDFGFHYFGSGNGGWEGNRCSVEGREWGGKSGGEWGRGSKSGREGHREGSRLNWGSNCLGKECGSSNTSKDRGRSKDRSRSNDWGRSSWDNWVNETILVQVFTEAFKVNGSQTFGGLH